jgi:hypothetical protein
VQTWKSLEVQGREGPSQGFRADRDLTRGAG